MGILNFLCHYHSLIRKKRLVNAFFKSVVRDEVKDLFFGDLKDVVWMYTYTKFFPKFWYNWSEPWTYSYDKKLIARMRNVKIIIYLIQLADQL